MRLIWSLTLLIFFASQATAEQISDSIESAIQRAIFNASAAPIQSHVELETHLYDSSGSPFAAMTQHQQTLFKNSAVFTDNGLASFYMPALRGLSVSEAARILALFGWQENISVFADLLEVRDVKDSEILAATSSFCFPRPIIIDGMDDGSLAAAESGQREGEAQQCGPHCVLPIMYCSKRASCAVRTNFVCNLCSC